MQLPREVIVGKGALTRVTEVAKRLGLSGSALIVAGPKSCEIAGKQVSDLLQQKGLNVDTLLVKTVTIKDILMVEERIKEGKPKVLIGVGGGTKIDAAKLSASRQGIPFISIPTALSHDGIASPLASVKGLDKPYSIMAQAPLAIIADTDVIAHAPWRSVISGCGDAISKFTAVKDWRLAKAEKNEYYGEYAASLALMSAKLVIENAELIQPGNDEGLRVLLEALISCGVAMSIAGSSRPCSGSEHLFSHALDMVSCPHAMHGEQCGVGSVLSAYLHKAKWKRIRDSLKQIGAPTTAAELGVKDENLVKALEMAATIRPERYTILHKLKLNRQACEKAAKITGVIN
ncbi:glycerol-1-phosphate dehydrogenase [miscellaneous Crenarchaeota group-1 archaeon SG8-32-3]|uniref:Glycerol-1-phosphate dehydrogenase [NAD(P)+] n=1 Tax=miscellaneous Crenarchaeota group-1 archaeon SG8-32-3 TaxID=1685125 RepID=A0A0M0BTE8_9ARCH|nr:MAG: glycerol-1-phosphate dehydrogenase [miscellaneous Crenarchaeota group-1 archaeon SG8-32-3]